MKWRTKPAKYENAKQMQKIIDKYFEECEENNEFPTVTGLAFALNMNRQDLINYENCLENGRLLSLDDSAKAEIVDAIKRAKKYIEMCYEQRLFANGNPAGTIFTLKNNYKWVDKSEVEQTNKTITVQLED
ncbi:DNA-packaging protein [Inconstantimicrobium mannanitabidum]|uniref:Uncharacterized protein n=1 Tax=Inconstantimicrobium mannanitabidum TaxID=1604901 RepID=A0ACB5R9W2_9CLOT|nr:DNA-packaging protein [Clostridium sp. TW13]GKX65825.1 hypothetical protein rsdtw13_10830 [Clostridium sp. TW13]